MLLNATPGLWLGMASALATQRGVLLESENVYFRAVQECAGIDSAWAKAFRQASGLEEVAGDGLLMENRAKGALRLYRERAILLSPVLKSEHAAVVQQALKLIEQS